MLREKKQAGIALITTVMFSTMVIIMTGVIFFRISHASKEIVKRDILDRTNSMTDAALSNFVNWLNTESWDETKTSKFDKNQNIEKHALAFIENLYNSEKEDLMQTQPLSLSKDKPNLIMTSYEPFIISELKNSAFDPNNTTVDILPSMSLIDWTKSKFLYNFMTGTNSINVILTESDQGVKKLVSNLGLTSNFDNLSETEKLYKMELNRLANIMYRRFEIETAGIKNINHKQTVRISIIPLTTNITNDISELELHGCPTPAPSETLSSITSLSGKCDRERVIGHVDVYKVLAKTCMPECDSANTLYTRYHELIIQRPVVTASDYNLAHAVLADGSIDLKNAKTNSGTTYLDSTNEGDIHSNHHIAIGPQGSIGGKVTSAGYVYFGNQNQDADSFTGDEAHVVPTYGIHEDHPLYSTDKIFNKAESKSKVDKIEVPELEFEDLPTTECPIPYEDQAILKDCYIDGDYNQTKTQQFSGTVHIIGNYTQKGDFYAIGNEPVRIIVGDGTGENGKITIGGNSKTAAESLQEVMFVSHYESESDADPAIKIAGNPGTGVDSGALFYTSNPKSSVQIRGTADVYGSIMAKGTVQFDGSMTMKRDTKMSALKRAVPPKQEQTKIQVVSWKELKEN